MCVCVGEGGECVCVCESVWGGRVVRVCVVDRVLMLPLAEHREKLHGTLSTFKEVDTKIKGRKVHGKYRFQIYDPTNPAAVIFLPTCPQIPRSRFARCVPVCSRARPSFAASETS